jgi:hypothetical protein
MKICRELRPESTGRQHFLTYGEGIGVASDLSGA